IAMTNVPSGAAAATPVALSPGLAAARNAVWAPARVPTSRTAATPRWYAWAAARSAWTPDRCAWSWRFQPPRTARARTGATPRPQRPTLSRRARVRRLRSSAVGSGIGAPDRSTFAATGTGGVTSLGAVDAAGAVGAAGTAGVGGWAAVSPGRAA